MALTLNDANRMVTAAIAKARDMNIGMSIAVVDAGGHLLAFNRIEDSMWLAAHAAQGKAVATSALGWASADIPSDNPVIQGIFASLGGLMVSLSSENVLANWPAEMSHSLHGECDIESQRTGETSGSEQSAG